MPTQSIYRAILFAVLFVVAIRLFGVIHFLISSVLTVAVVAYVGYVIWRQAVTKRLR